MVIRISLGNVGSGKTLNEVREMVLNPKRVKYLSNIHTSLPYQTDLNKDMIYQEILDEKTKKVKLSLNQEFWKTIKEPTSVVLDEFHALADPRASTSKQSRMLMQWVALIRKFIGENSTREGDLVIITQLPNRVDLIVREMAHEVRHHVCWYDKRCTQCDYTWTENNQMMSHIYACPNCGQQDIIKENHRLWIGFFSGMDHYFQWLYGSSDPVKVQKIKDISKYFGYYNTLQVQDLFGNL